MKNMVYLRISALVMIADQISKWLLLKYLVETKEYAILPFFNIVVVHNKGVSFGMFKDLPEFVGPWLLSGLAIAICAFFLLWITKVENKMQPAAIALVIGGALGNVVDRLRFGSVVDFLDFHIGNWHWPAFNIADSAVCIGVAILIIHSLFFENKPQQAS